MARFKINGLRWWIIEWLLPGSIVNFLTRRTLVGAGAAKPHNRAIAIALPALHPKAAHA